MKYIILFSFLFLWNVSLGQSPGEVLEDPHYPSELLRNNFVNLLNIGLNDYRDSFMAEIRPGVQRFYSTDNSECFGRSKVAGLNQFLFQIKVVERVNTQKTYAVSDIKFIVCNDQELFKIQITRWGKNLDKIGLGSLLDLKFKIRRQANEDRKTIVMSAENNGGAFLSYEARYDLQLQAEVERLSVDDFYLLLETKYFTNQNRFIVHFPTRQYIPLQIDDPAEQALNLSCRTNFAETSLRDGLTRVVIDHELSNLLDLDTCMNQLSRPLMNIIAVKTRDSLEENGPAIPGDQNLTLTNQILVEELETKLNQFRAGGNDKVIEAYLQGLLESAEKGEIQDLRPPQ